MKTLIPIHANVPAAAEDNGPQYSLSKIIAIWAAVTLPMGLLAWVIAPAAMPWLSLDHGIVYWMAMVLGMVWQFAVAIIVLRGERRDWTWARLKARLWLTAPRSPRTGRAGAVYFLAVIPAILFVGLTSDLLGPWIDTPMHWLFPDLAMPVYSDIRQLISPRFEGQWWLLVIAIVSNLFNYVLGEALLFHGVLLPKMRGVFGRWAWLANAVVFGLYHVHLLMQMPSIVVSNIAYSLPAQRYRSVWLAVLIHGFEGVVVIALTVWVILGRP